MKNTRQTIEKKIQKLEDKFSSLCSQIERIEDQMESLYNDAGDFDTVAIENKWFRLDDKKYTLEDRQGDVQEQIETLEKQL